MYLNLGSDVFKLDNFINIDINASVNPDLNIDLLDLDKYFNPDSVDFIFASHVLEHLTLNDSQQVLSLCKTILKPYSMMILVVPDYTKIPQEYPIELTEKIIYSSGDHKILFNKKRIENMLQHAGFSNFFEIMDLKKVPYLLVPDIRNPEPEIWQTAYLAFKK